LETFCAQCHFGPTGSKTPDANLWTHGRANHAAGAPFDFKNEPSVTAVCTRCHQLANTFTQAPAQTGCTNCHGFAVHAADYLADHRAAALADLLPCRQCHDTPGTVPNFDGYVSGVACTQCHPDALAHPFTAGAFPGWADHSSAGNVPAACAICHSTAIPSSGPSPLSAAPPCAECHADGFVAHAFPFVASHLAAAKADLTVCQRCHSDNPTGGPGSDPRFNVPFPQFSVVGTANNGCESCHVAYTAHPVPWLDHMTAGNIFGACALCHGASLEGGTNAPACTTCHSNAHAVPYPDHGAAALADPTVCELCHGQDLAGEYGPACATCHTLAPLTNAGCTSCHNEPPNGGAPVGNQYANRAGQHAGHLGLPTAGIGCATCHPDPATAQGATQHYADAKLRQAPATVTLSATYQAKTGTLAFQGNGLTGGTCSAVSCHGGQQTPNWLTGTIDVNTQCTACHASGTAQWNSYSSGRHSLHVSFAACTECHNTTNLATNHFTALDTTAMEGPASGTIGGGTTSIPAGGYTPGVTAGTGSCSPSCHGTETW
jgi:predicted CxxxxCH...CXXCH cytochrome family protein